MLYRKYRISFIVVVLVLKAFYWFSVCVWTVNKKMIYIWINKTKMMMINMTASYTIFFIWPHDIPCWNINSFELSIIDCLQTVYCYTDISVSFVQKNISIRTEFRLCHNMAQNHFLHDRTLIIFCFVDFGFREIECTGKKRKKHVI